MSDQAAEKIQNMSIQDYDASEYDPYAPQSNMAAVQSNGQGLEMADSELTNGHGKCVSFEQNQLPDPYVEDEQTQADRMKNLQRNMSEGEILGYQTEYGESVITGQMEYGIDSDNEDGAQNGPPQPRNYGNHSDRDYYMSTGQPLMDYDNEMQDLPPVGDDYMGEEGGGYVDQGDENFDNGVPIQGQCVEGGESFDNSETDQGSWHPQMDAERSRRSLSPERSMSPRVDSQSVEISGVSSPQFDSESLGNLDSEGLSSPSEVQLPPPSSTDSDPHSGIPFSDSQSVTSASEADTMSPRVRKKGIPKPKIRKALELPPWDDNVVIPPPPRMKPTLIGKQADLPPTPPSPMRHKSAHHSRRADASSDSGVEEDKNLRSPRKSSADVKKKYGTDTKNERYKPGGGNIQVFSEKVDVKSITPRTDSTKPRSLASARSSPAPDRIKSPTPGPNTKNVQSKIGSLKNVKHSPGGGNVQVMSSKVDYTNVKSKVGSKDKIDHKPKGGDKKILDQKVEFKAQSKVGSTANIKHKPGGGDKKIESVKLDFKDTAKSRVGSMDKIKHKPGGGDVKILDEKVDFSQIASPKVGSMEKVKHQPGGGDKKIETQKLNFKETAKPRTDTGVASGEKVRSANHSRSESVTSSQDGSVQG